MNSINYIYSNLDKSNKYLLIMICIIIILLVLIMIVNKISKKKIKVLSVVKDNNSSDEFDIRPSVKILKGNKIINNLEKQDNNLTIKDNEVIKESIKETKINVVENVNNKEDEEEIIEVIEDEKITDIDNILLKMEESGNQMELDLTEFEREQEENAIISYDELCKKAGVKKIVYKTKTPENNEKKMNKENAIVYSKKYEPSKVISPIFGYQNNYNKEENKSLISSNDDTEFLGNLKQFRNGLE